MSSVFLLWIFLHLSCGFVFVIPVSITALWWQCNQLQWPCMSGHLSVDTRLDVWCKIDALKLVERLLQVLEIRPAIAWDKGKAVDFLLSSLGEYNSCRKHIRSAMLSASIFCNLWHVRVIAQKRNWFWYGYDRTSWLQRGIPSLYWGWSNRWRCFQCKRDLPHDYMTLFILVSIHI
jgi:hypothetical protein